MRFLLLGLGISNRAMMSLLEKEGHSVTVYDENIVDLSSFDQIIISPSVPLDHPLLQKAHIPYFCDIEYIFQKKPSTVVGITGTNGKTTTVLLLEKMLKSRFSDAQSCGNVGVPIADVYEKSPLVVELSSFQLQTVSTPVLDAAIILNITLNHLNYHKTFQDYRRAKMRISELVKPGGRFFVHETLDIKGETFGFLPTSSIYSDTHAIYRFGKKEGLLPEMLQGKKTHDVENFLAAYALARELNLAPEQCIEAYQEFQKPPHRLQFVSKIDGVSYYNDSKATSVDATLHALDSLDAPLILLAGGVHKGAEYSKLFELCQKKVKALFCFGEASQFIQQDLHGSTAIFSVEDLQEALSGARAYAKRGDTILLSPACSSFDQFSSYEERGNRFQEFVQGFVQDFEKSHFST